MVLSGSDYFSPYVFIKFSFSRAREVHSNRQ